MYKDTNQRSFSGILVVDKPSGWTSFDVVGKLRSLLSIKKIGHTGTLDPMATGVLPVCIGKATKLVSMLENDTKCYQTTFLLGVRTTTQDITGDKIGESEVNLSKEEIIQAIHSFLGKYLQVPPMYSAKSVGGKRLYQLAREGIEIDRPAKEKYIYRIDNIQIHLPYVSMEVECSKGTYIRTLCADIGEKLGTGATMSQLRRVQAGVFGLEGCVQIDEVVGLLERGELSSKIVGIDKLLEKYPKLIISNQKQVQIYNGASFSKEDIIQGDISEVDKTYLVFLEDNELIGLYTYQQEDELFTIWKMFRV